MKIKALIKPSLIPAILNITIGILTLLMCISYLSYRNSVGVFWPQDNMVLQILAIILVAVLILAAMVWILFWDASMIRNNIKREQVTYFSKRFNYSTIGSFRACHQLRRQAESSRRSEASRQLSDTPLATFSPSGHRQGARERSR
jgi:hypothetical protein